MAVTFRQMMNRVLTNLTEDELSVSTTEITDTYEKLVRNFVNIIKEEMEDAAQWRVLQTTATATVAASGESIAISGTNERSRLVRVFDSSRHVVTPLVYNTTDADSPGQMEELDLQELKRRRRRDSSEPNVEDSHYFALEQTTAGLTLVVYPASTKEQTFSVELVVPQDRFAADVNDIDSAISVPALPLELGATWFALEERGEELGVSGVFSEQRYRTALDSAIARDEAEQGNINELVAV